MYAAGSQYDDSLSPTAHQEHCSVLLSSQSHHTAVTDPLRVTREALLEPPERKERYK